jgi:hypothetical protein
MITKPNVLEAQTIAQRIPAVMQRRGLRPAFTDWLLTEDRELIWLFGVLDQRRIKKLEHYTRNVLLHHLSTAIGGRPVYLSNHSGLRYAVLLSTPPRLPETVAFPGRQRGHALLGQRYTGQTLAVPWSRLGHLLVAGKTGAGKSNFLRLLVHQALAAGHRLLLADRDNATFPMLAEHPALLAPLAHDEQAMLEIVERGLGTCEHRVELYAQLPGFPEKLAEYNHIAVQEGAEPLPRVLVVLDEYNAAVLAAGGAKGPLATAVAELGWRGRKFGVHVVFAAQDFSKAIVGRIRDQVSAALCFRVRSQAVARHVGCPDAVRIPESRPGLAVTDRWGPLQTFYLDKRLLIRQGRQRAGARFSDAEQDLIRKALAESEGRMSIPLLVKWGMTEKPARKLLKAWELRGWVQKDPQRDNARYITPKLRALWSNRQTGQTGASRVKPGQTG